ncbi:2'-5' RNA ligase family protein [Streptomyces sp. NPDC001339]|uniref:2'-5' RNA ligase family protein n=1 Tax=Streptomyces sp. NPDC001339 TaxID=3364563 RepID=UPI0036909676
MTGHRAQHSHMANHWWWRPGWQQGSRFLTFHFTFQDAADVHRLAADYRLALADVNGLDLVPDSWLHLTTQGLGFASEVRKTDVQAILDAAGERLSTIPAFDLTLDCPEITPEAVRWEATPSAPPTEVRSALREAIGTVWSDVPEDDGFAPHVSIAYSNDTGPAAPVQAALDAVDSKPSTAHVRSVELILLNRDQHMYQWETYARLPLA